MKTTQLKHEKKLQLNVIKDSSYITKSLNNHINTLDPKFSYTNTKGENVSPKSHVKF